MSKKILIVEDDEITALSIETFLENEGYDVLPSVNCADDALEMIKTNNIALVLSDINILGAVDGSQLAKKVYLEHGIRTIFLTAYYNDELMQEAIEAKAYTYLVKPYREFELKTAIELAFSTIKSDAPTKIKIVNFSSFKYEDEKFFKDNEEIKFTKKESKLLEILIKSINNTVSQEELALELYEKDDNSAKTNLRKIISRLRSKYNIEISTHKSQGYSLSNANPS